MIKITLAFAMMICTSSLSFSQSVVSGKPAPLFQGVDAGNKAITTRDFLGKVIYIDLWASWCGPCRKETPHLKRVYKKYAADTNIVFLSIAVADTWEDWKEAMEQDKPTWPQLFDQNKKTFYLFGNELAIPRFILIGKNGSIISDDAPRPSKPKALEKLLAGALQ